MKFARLKEMRIKFLKFMGRLGVRCHDRVGTYAAIYAFALYSSWASLSWNWLVGTIYVLALAYLRMAMKINVVFCIRCGRAIPSFLSIRVAEGPLLPPTAGPYCEKCFDYLNVKLSNASPGDFSVSIH